MAIYGSVVPQERTSIEGQMKGIGDVVLFEFGLKMMRGLVVDINFYSKYCYVILVIDSDYPHIQGEILRLGRHEVMHEKF